MSRLRLTDHRLAVGIQTATYMTTHETRIKLFPLQPDQGTGAPAWCAPSYPLGTKPPDYARYRGELEVGDGFRIWQWVFSYWTNGMLAYFKTTYPHGSTVTVGDYDDENHALYLTAVLLHPRPETHMESDEGGWKTVRIRFIKGRIIS